MTTAAKTRKAPAKAAKRTPAGKSATKRIARPAVKAAAARKKARPAAKAAAAKRPAGGATQNASTPATATGGGGAGMLRVRMYRIGFGDFFLLTVPTKAGPQHILIDCGVHAGNIGTMDDCIKDMVNVTGKKLALVIATHYHADHLSGFATNYTDFAEFEVGAVWITNRLDPGDSGAVKFQAQITSLANRLSLQLAARQDLAGKQALAKVQNALGAAGGGNVKALQLLTSGFKNKPKVYYYEAGDAPDLPPELQGALTAQLLGPAPKKTQGAYSASDNRTEQYLAAVADGEISLDSALDPFKNWVAGAGEYPVQAFREYRTAEEIDGKPAELERALHAVQPDALAATADALDGTLNNQSLVVLFTCQGKKLLFVGDAQWGNWEYWLYGKPVTGQDPGITPTAKQILGSIDFYKVGHHGSTNATPIPAVDAMAGSCVAMCSTQTGAYGNSAKGTEVPRTKLMEALEQKLGGKLVRSDWIKAGTAKADPEALKELAKLPSNFAPGNVYIDYIFP